MNWHSADGERCAIVRGEATQLASVESGDQLLALEDARLYLCRRNERCLMAVVGRDIDRRRGCGPA
jgi:hypothetical protein